MSQPELSDWRQALQRLAELNADAASKSRSHYKRATKLSSREIKLGISVVILAAVAGILTSGVSSPNLALRLSVVGLTVAAAVVSGAQTALRSAMSAAHERVLAEQWSAMHREFQEMLALDSAWLAKHSAETKLSAQTYLHDAVERLAEIERQPSRPSRSRWREHAVQQEAEIRAAAIAEGSSLRADSLRKQDRNAINDLEMRMAGNAYSHDAIAEKLAALDLKLGVATLILLAFTPAIILLTLGDHFSMGVQLLVASSCVAAALTASLRTFFRMSERAHLHAEVAEHWAELRRSITRRRMQPSASGKTPASYLEGIIESADRLSEQSPEIRDQVWQDAYGRRKLSFPAEEATARFRVVFPVVRVETGEDGQYSFSPSLLPRFVH